MVFRYLPDEIGMPGRMIEIAKTFPNVERTTGYRRHIRPQSVYLYGRDGRETVLMPIYDSDLRSVNRNASPER